MPKKSVIWPVVLLLFATCVHRPCRNGMPVFGPSPCDEHATYGDAPRRSLVAWLECDDCSDSDVFKLTEFDDSLMPLVRLALLEGPSQASEELLRQSLSRRWDEMRVFAATHPETDIPGTREQFVNSNLSNFNARYQLRAARALVVLAGPAARETLVEAIRRIERADVRASLQTFLNELPRGPDSP